MMLRRNEIVRPSGLRRTEGWGEMFGIVTDVLENSILVSWHGLEFEDEMEIDEVISTSRFAETMPEELRLIREHEIDSDITEGVDYDN